MKSNQSLCSMGIPGKVAGKEIYLCLEISDQNKIVSLSDFRKIVSNFI